MGQWDSKQFALYLHQVSLSHFLSHFKSGWDRVSIFHIPGKWTFLRQLTSLYATFRPVHFAQKVVTVRIGRLAADESFATLIFENILH